MEKLKIVGWDCFECKYPTRRCSGEELSNMVHLIEECIYENGYVFSGEEHQNSITGVPVFSDGTCFRASMRCWAGMMALVYSEPERELSYMDFYMSLGSSSVLPKVQEIDVEPADIKEVSFGCSTKVDREMLTQCLDLDMDFMTNDKVLIELFKKMKSMRNEKSE